MQTQLSLPYAGNPEFFPIADHPDDIVYREDTEDESTKRESVMGSDGLWYSCQESADENDQEKWSEVWQEFEEQACEWLDEYAKSDDYGSEYAYLLSECHHRSEDQIAEWVQDKSWLSKSVAESIAAEVVSEIIDSAECEWSDEYSSTPSGLYLDSFSVGEQEDQVDWSRFVEWCEEYAPEDIRGIIPPMWFINDQSSHSNMREDDRYPCFYVYSYPGIRWDYTCPQEVAAEIILREIRGMSFESDDIPDVIRLQNELSRIADNPDCDQTPIIEEDRVLNKAGSVSLHDARMLVHSISLGNTSGRTGDYAWRIVTNREGIKTLRIGCQCFSWETVETLKEQLNAV